VGLRAATLATSAIPSHTIVARDVPAGQIAVSTSCKGIILIADNAHYGKATESSPRTIGRAHARAARVTPVEALRL
jgi:hypothetical protein